MPNLKAQRDNANRRSRARGRNERLTTEQLKEKYISSGRLCGWCGRLLSKGTEIDHIFPLSKSGTNSIENITYCCPKCNSAKGSMSPFKFAALMRVRGFNTPLIRKMLKMGGLDHIGAQMSMNFDSSLPQVITIKKAA